MRCCRMDEKCRLVTTKQAFVKPIKVRHGKLHVNCDKCLILINPKRSMKMTDDIVTASGTVLYSIEYVNGSINGTLVTTEWDSWDTSLWTPEQRRLLNQGAFSRHVHFPLGILLTLVVLFGIIANSVSFFDISR